jgi:hypothetical protein
LDEPMRQLRRNRGVTVFRFRVTTSNAVGRSW